MDLTELRQQIAAGEDSHFEWKSVVHAKGGLPDADDLAKALCSFANSGGGHLVLGVEDDGSITGIGDRAAADALQRHVSQIARRLDPPLAIDHSLYELEARRVLAIGVSPFQTGRPFSWKSRYYVRDGNLSRDAHRAELDRLFASQGTVTHDEQPVADAPLQELDAREVRELLTLAYPRFREEDTLKYLQSAHCAEGGRLTVAGTLLFTSEPSRHVKGAIVSALRFDGEVARTATTAHETFTLRRTDGALPSHATPPRPLR